MQRLVDIEIDQEFQLHTSYHNDFFLLRTKVLVDGNSTEIRTVQEGNYEGPVLMVCHSGSTSCKLWLIANAVSPILHRFGVYHVDTFYYEQSPLFHTVFSSESCLRKFLLAVGEVRSAMETKLHYLLSRNLKSTQCHVPEADSPQLTIEVQPELFLVSPNQLNTKGADLHVVTADNCSTLLTHWKSSKLFEFASLYQEEAQPPHITLHPASQNDVVPGGSLTLLIRATGAEPLSYQWQWKPAGKEDEQHEWQDLSRDSTTFQEVEGGLKLAGVQECHAGDYRCVVSNSVGSEISQCANLTVAEAPKITIQPTSQNDVLPGSPLGFTIKATGAKPLSYQWQWKPVGKEDEQHEWQDLSGDSTTFQEGEGGLKFAGVQACHAGDYRCVVSNSAGSEISQGANLTVAEPPKITSQPMSQKDVLQGSPLDFIIRATGTQPLRYQWQWTPSGKEQKWKNLSCDDTTFQEVEAGLKLAAVQASHAGDYRCVVSNSAGSEISQSATLTIKVVPKLRDLVRELQSVNNWITFGLCLGVEIEKLNAIEMERSTIEDRRIKMLEEWQNNVIPTWPAVVQALMEIGKQRLASKLAQKHGIPIPEQPDDYLLEQLKNVSQQKATGAKLCEDIQKHGDDLKENHKRLAESEEHLRQLQESKQAANENANDCLTELEKLREDVQKIAQEKSNIEMELKIKERECQLLSEIKEDKAYNVQLLENKIAKKKKKINGLKQKLQSTECKLQSAQQEAQTCQEKLSQALAEVRKKHEEVKELQRENEKLTTSYDIKKEEISSLVQIAVTSVKEMKQQIVNMKEESELNLQHMEASYNANIRHLSEEIEALTSSLQKKEAAAEHLQVASTPEQLLESLTLMIQIAELEHRLQDTEYQKQHAELKREAAVREVKARKDFEVQLHAVLDEPPNITSHPDSLKEVRPGKAVAFTVQATGTRPLTYEWQWKPAEEGDESEEWQSCDVEGPTLTISRVQKSDEGQYRCVIYNHAGRQISKPAQLETGTLTQNVMTFLKCSIQGVKYGEVSPDDKDKEEVVTTGELLRRQKLMSWETYSVTKLEIPLVDFTSWNDYADPNFRFYDQDLLEKCREKNEECDEFFKLLCLCHTVLPSMETGILTYNAQSPYEAALVSAARNFGYVFKARTPFTTTVDMLNIGCEVQYEVLNILDFNNERKRMSVIVKYNGKITLYCKGADSVVFARLSDESTPLMKVTQEHLVDYAREGLRTLVLAKKDIPEEEYREWAEEHYAASIRDQALDLVYNKIEQRLTLLGATAIEDKLQDGVPDRPR